MNADLMPVYRVLSLLEKVREVKPGHWVACCPAHPDKTPSLSITEADDGRVLLHDFGGCSTDKVVSTVGLELSDLFPHRPITHAGPLPRNRRPDSPPAISPKDVLLGLESEVFVVLLLASDMLARLDFFITPEDYARMNQAVEAIQGACSYIREVSRHG